MANMKLVDANTFVHVIDAAGRCGRAYIKYGGVYWFRDDEVGDGVTETQYATYASNPEGRFTVKWIKAESKLFKDCQPVFDADKVLALDEDRYVSIIREAYWVEAAQ